MRPVLPAAFGKLSRPASSLIPLLVSSACEGTVCRHHAVQTSRRKSDSKAYEYRPHRGPEHRPRRRRYCRLSRRWVSPNRQPGSSFQMQRKRQRRASAHRHPDDGTEVTERTAEMKCTENKPAMRTLLVRALSFSAAAALALNPAMAPVVAAEATAMPVVAGGPAKTRFLPLGIGKSVVIDLPRDVKDVLVADPKTANAVIRSARRAYLIGVTVGQTNVFFFDAEGKQIAGFDIAVTRDLNGIRAALKQLLPNADIRIDGPFRSVTATLRAMERAGVIRTLAEPTLTAISGETATFLAGGEFPIPSGLSCDTTKVPPVCQPQIEWKKFGVGLNFTPVVLSEGRISLKVMTEVSDLSTENAITFAIPGSTQQLTVPSIRTRRADTVLELPSGGSLAMAGMIQDQTKQQINGLPGLMQIPVLGAL